MSQTDTAPKTLLPVRWIVLFTGSKATEDYVPSASTGETDDLVKEVSRLCVDFHPHAEIRAFPQDNEVLLFWRAKATSDFIVTRVTVAPNPRGLRTALEYCSLVFSETEFARLGYDPFRARDLKLHDLVREQFLGSGKAPVEFSLPAAAKTAGGKRGTGGTGLAPAPGADATATPENLRALHDYIVREAEAGHVPPTFATWWAGGTQPPSGYFEIVLRAVPLRALTLRDAIDQAAALAAEIKSSLPNAPAGDANAAELSRSIMTNADALQRTVAGVGSRLNTDTADQFRDGLGEASGQALRVAGDLKAFGARLGADLSEENAAAMTDMAHRYEALGRELPGIRHPNPFGNRPAIATNGGAAPVTATSRSTTTVQQPGGSGGMKYVAGGAAVAVIALLAIWKGFSGGGGGGNASGTVGKTQPGEKPAPAASVSAPATLAAPAVDPAIATLVQEQDAVASAAQKRAHDAAKAAAAKATVSETTVEKITAGAINQAYKQKLAPAQYQAAFKSPWDYARFKETLATLTPSVHEAAMVGATEGKVAAAAAQARKREIAAATPAPTPRSTPTPEARVAKRSEKGSDSSSEKTSEHRSRRSSDNEQKTASSSKPKEKKTASASTPAPHKAASSSGPKTGSAAQTGL